MQKYLLLAPVFLLVACTPPNPIVSDFNGDSVKIQSSQFEDAKESQAAAQIEADRICQRGNRKRAEYASTRSLPNYLNEHLFLCLDS